jgi:hypothetical protein
MLPYLGFAQCEAEAIGEEAKTPHSSLSDSSLFRSGTCHYRSSTNVTACSRGTRRA